MSTVAEALETSTLILREGGIAEPAREAKSLLAFVLERNRTFLIAHSEYELTAAEEKRFESLAKRRANREPFQYIVGRQEFYGLDFAVTPDVLIPRPETELIVEAALEILLKKENSRFCEVGVGSGCIAVSILHHAKRVTAIGLDISERALKVTAENAATHSVGNRLKLKISNVFDDLQAETFDLIVSNPPYIPLEEIMTLQPEVRDYEPLTALTDNRNGLSIVEKIINDAPKFLHAGGALLMEIGYNQSKRVAEKFDREVWREVEFLPDLQNIPRTVKAIKK